MISHSDDWKKKISDSVKRQWKENYNSRVLAVKKTAEKLKGQKWGHQTNYQKLIASKTHKGKLVSSETRSKQRESRLKFIMNYPDLIKKYGQLTGTALKGRKQSPKVVATIKEKWKNPEYREMKLKQMLKFKSPNYPERRMLEMIERNNLPYKFVGDGSLIIKGFNPDFVNYSGEKILLEVFGDYWHNRLDWRARDIVRLKEFESLGYRTLIFWEHEIVKRKEVKNSPTLTEENIVQIIKSGRRDMFDWYSGKRHKE